MKKEKKTIIAECQEDVCPLCGCTDLKYGAREDDYNGGAFQRWDCPECGAYGKEGIEYTFDGYHFDVHDGDDNPVEILSPVKEPKRWLHKESGFNTCPECNHDVAEHDDTGHRQCFDFCPYCGTQLED